MSFAEEARRVLAGRAIQAGLGDKEIRVALLRQLHILYIGSPQHVLALEEFGISKGRSRVDIAVLSQEYLTGYEIKSDLDSLKRLMSQSMYYEDFLDRAYLIVGDKLVSAATQLCPLFWGITQVSVERGGRLSFSKVRHPGALPVNPYRWLDLLWREEVLDIFRALKKQKNLTRLPKEALEEAWKEHFTPAQTRALILNALYNRADWRRRDPKTIHRLGVIEK